MVCWGNNGHGQLGSGTTAVNVGSTGSQMGSNLQLVDLGAGSNSL